MATSTSSTRKAAKLAKQGNRSVRFQGGAVFPLAISLTLILGLALIVYSRQSRPPADASPPTASDHWHATYGFYLCDTWFELQGALEDRNSNGGLTNVRFQATGVHSHDDGVIHWHPYTSASIGTRARLKVFLGGYDVQLDDDKLTFPDNNIPTTGIQEYIEGETKCNGEDAQLSVRTWGLYTDTEEKSSANASLDEIRFDQDKMVFGIYFVPIDADRPKPPDAADLLNRAQNDGGGDVNNPNVVGPDSSTPLVTLPGPDSSTPVSVAEGDTATTVAEGDTATTVAEGDTATTVAEGDTATTVAGG